MKLALIPKKKKGQFREIAILDKKESSEYKKFVPYLNELSKTLCTENVHGFMIGKSAVTNAEAHIGKKYTLSFDLENFFDSVRIEHVKKVIKSDVIEACMPNGRAYQGLPTSPAIANIAAREIDQKILKFLDGKAIYTRYADDISISFDDENLINLIKGEIPKITGKCNFKINKSKTRLQFSGFGKRVITGIAVDENSVQPTRETKRKIRAAAHKKNEKSLAGLIEWASLKKPKETKKGRLKENKSAVKRLIKRWKLQKLNIFDVPKKKEVRVSEDCLITGDPIYMIGLSNWSTSWSSCMSHPDPAKWLGTRKSSFNVSRHGVYFWNALEGARVAILESSKTYSVCKVERKLARARTLVFESESGYLFYSKVYSESEGARTELINKLHDFGVVDGYKKAIEIKGSVAISELSKGAKPYCDAGYGKIIEEEGVLKFRL